MPRPDDLYRLATTGQEQRDPIDPCDTIDTASKDLFAGIEQLAQFSEPGFQFLGSIDHLVGVIDYAGRHENDEFSAVLVLGQAGSLLTDCQTRLLVRP